MRIGQKIKLLNLDGIDPDNVPIECEDLYRMELTYSGKRDDEFAIYEAYDDEDNPVYATAYRFEFVYDGDELYVYLLPDNFSITNKKKPTNELEWLDAVQQNFKE